MAPIVLAAAVWGRTWHRSRVCFRCDNAAVVPEAIHQGSYPFASPLLLVFYAALFRFSYCPLHLPGISNVAADALSRNNMSLFLSLVPQGSQALWRSATCCCGNAQIGDLFPGLGSSWLLYDLSFTRYLAVFSYGSW